MSARRTSYGKVARERDKKAKAAAKREQRQSRGTDAPGDEETSDLEEPSFSGPELSTEELLKMVEELHQRFDGGLLSYDEYEEQKSELLGRIKLD